MTSNTPTILAGDLNAKHHSWGCRAPDSRNKGDALYDLLLQHELSVEAPATFTHFPSTRGHQPDILDIFITKNLTLREEPYVLAELCSNHAPVVLEIPVTPASLPLTTPKLDWLHLQYLLETMPHQCSQIRTVADVDSVIAYLTEAISDAVRQATTEEPIRRTSSKLPASTLRLKREKNRVRRLWQRTRDPNIRPLLNSLQRELSQRLKKFSDDSFENYISLAEKHPKNAWKVIKSLRNRRPQLPPLRKDGNSYSLDEDKAEIFASSLASQCSPFESSLEHAEFHRQVTEEVANFVPTDHDIQPCSPKEIADIIRGLSKNKAPGRDAIKNGVLKILPGKMIVTVCNIVNAMMRLQYFPTAWKEATVVCLPKAGKPLSSPTSYRPISLLSSLSKVAESVILSRIQRHSDAHRVIPGFQMGFVKHHSTLHQLLRVSEYVADRTNDRWFTPMLLLDAKQAFDRVWHDGLIYKMIGLGFPHYLIGIIKSFLTDRNICVRVGKSLSTSRPITASVPQGSKLSPLLFNIYCHDIPVNPRIMTAQYADDVALVSSTNTISHATNRINKFLPGLIDWYHRWRFELNEKKSEAVLVTHKRQKLPPNIVVNGHVIPWSTNAKYLGTTFDHRYTWSCHIDATRNKARGAFVALKPFFNNRTVSQGMKARAFNAIIRSICTYAIPIWGAADPKLIDGLQGSYMRLLRGALKIPWYIRNDQILAETKILSLPQAAKKYASNLRRLVENNRNPYIRALTDYQTKRLDLRGRPHQLAEVAPTG